MYWNAYNSFEHKAPKIFMIQLIKLKLIVNSFKHHNAFYQKLFLFCSSPLTAGGARRGGGDIKFKVICLYNNKKNRLRWLPQLFQIYFFIYHIFFYLYISNLKRMYIQYNISGCLLNLYNKLSSTWTAVPWHWPMTILSIP